MDLQHRLASQDAWVLIPNHVAHRTTGVYFQTLDLQGDSPASDASLCLGETSLGQPLRNSDVIPKMSECVCVCVKKLTLALLFLTQVTRRGRRPLSPRCGSLRETSLKIFVSFGHGAATTQA